MFINRHDKQHFIIKKFEEGGGSDVEDEFISCTVLLGNRTESLIKFINGKTKLHGRYFLFFGTPIHSFFPPNPAILKSFSISLYPILADFNYDTISDATKGTLVLGTALRTIKLIEGSSDITGPVTQSFFVSNGVVLTINPEITCYGIYFKSNDTPILGEYFVTRQTIGSNFVNCFMLKV